MNLSDVRTRSIGNKTFRVAFVDFRDGSPLQHDDKPMYAVVVSKNSKAYERAFSRSVNAAKKAEKYGNQDFSLDKQKLKTAHLLAACTSELVYFDTDEGEEVGTWKNIENDIDLENSEAHSQIVKAYLDYDWMMDDIDKAIGNDANFLPKSATSSAPT